VLQKLVGEIQTVFEIRRWSLAFLVFVLLAGEGAFALAGPLVQHETIQEESDETIAVSPAEQDKLRALLEGSQISAILRDGTSVAGKVKSVEASTLRLLTKTPGPASSVIEVPVQKLSEIYLTEHRGKWRVGMPILLSSLGLAIAGFFLEEDDRNTWSLYALPLTGAAGGYYIGQRLDQRQVRVLIR